MFLDYNTAQRWVTPRSDKHAGAALGQRAYLKYDKTTDTFIVQHPVWSSTYSQEPIDEQGHTNYKKAPKKNWAFTPCATLFRDGSVEIFSATLSAHFLYKHWGVRLQRIKSAKEQGFKAYIGKSEGEPIGVLGAKFRISPDRKIVRLTPPKKRVVDEAKRKEIRTEIKRALRIITVREKLGAYPDSLHKEAYKLNGTEYSPLVYSAGGGVCEGTRQEGLILGAAAALYEAIQGVDESNLESAHALIQTALRFGRYYGHKQRPNYAAEVKRFIEARKSLIYKAMRAEYFVEEC